MLLIRSSRGVGGAFALQDSPAFAVENQQVRYALNIIRVEFHDETSRKEAFKVFDEIGLEIPL